MSISRRVFYGGQAVMEGVLMRGQTHASIAVRRPDGSIASKIQPVGLWGSTPFRRIPFVRGVIILAEALVMGMGALQWSANVALAEEGKELTRREMISVIIMSLAIASAIFFATPALFAGLIGDAVPAFFVHLLEGALRIALLLGYLFVIGRMHDVQRLFQYHGAEHKTIHAFEAGVPLDIAHIQPFNPAHPRCGTSFLLTVMVVSVFAFALVGEPPLVWRVLSRVVLLPVVAALSYEIMRFGATHLAAWWGAVTVAPGLALQRLTTRQPDDGQVEVALAAFTSLREVEASLPVLAGAHGELNA